MAKRMGTRSSHVSPHHKVNIPVPLPSADYERKRKRRQEDTSRTNDHKEMESPHHKKRNAVQFKSSEFVSDDDTDQPLDSTGQDRSRKKRKRSQHSDMTVDERSSPAAKHLAMIHPLGKPPNVIAEGRFTKDEAEIVRRTMCAYRNEHGMSISELVQLVQWTKPYVGREDSMAAQNQDMAITNRQFWRQIYEEFQGYPNQRTTTSIQKYVRRHYTLWKGNERWSEEEDELLTHLNKLYPGQWKLISTLMRTRSDSGCRDRWRDHLEKNPSRREYTWKRSELRRLREAMTQVTNSLLENGATASEDGSEPIDWGLVSETMGKSRNNVQCRRKWMEVKLRPDSYFESSSSDIEEEERIYKEAGDSEEVPYNKELGTNDGPVEKNTDAAPSSEGSSSEESSSEEPSSEEPSNEESDDDNEPVIDRPVQDIIEKNKEKAPDNEDNPVEVNADITSESGVDTPAATPAATSLVKPVAERATKPAANSKPKRKPAASPTTEQHWQLGDSWILLNYVLDQLEGQEIDGFDEEEIDYDEIAEGTLWKAKDLRMQLEDLVQKTGQPSFGEGLALSADWHEEQPDVLKAQRSEKWLGKGVES